LVGLLRSDESSREAQERTRLFEDLLRKYEYQIYRMAYRLTGNRDDAQDLVQDSVLEALRAFDRFHIGSRFDRWMQRIMTHNYIDRQRAQPKVEVESLDQSLGSEEEEERTLEVPDMTGDPARLLEERELAEPVQRALDELPAEYRAVVVLSDIEGYSYEEIAATLKVPIGTVRSRLNRGRNILRERLADYARERYGL
jgi:RNA polymerase sigma-70 factor (ECF subfamily)